MRELTKAQFTVGILACFAIGLGSIQKVLAATDLLFSFGIFVAQLLAVFVLSFILLAILKWVNIFVHICANYP